MAKTEQEKGIMTDSHKSTEVSTSAGFQLASALEGIEQLKRERAEYQHEYKRSMERLLADVARMRGEIITGQKSLFTEEPTPEPSRESVAEAQGAPVTYSDLPSAEEIISFCRERGQASVKEIVDHFGCVRSYTAITAIDWMDAQGLLLPAEGSAPRKFKEQSV